MSDALMTLTLSPERTRALQKLAAATGREADDLAATAIDFLIEDAAAAADIEAARADVRAGRTFTHEEVMAGLEDIIARAERRQRG